LVYYFPKTDVAATAISSRAIDCGSARGYGALETLTATELMVDEIAGQLGLDPIEFRLRNVLKTGMKNAQGAIPNGTQRAEAVLEKARAHALWSGRAARKQIYDAEHPGKYYGVGFGCIQRRFGTGAEASLAKVELAPDGRITPSHTGTEIGTGTSSGQAVASARWLGRPADVLNMAVTDWPDLPVETSGDPHAMSQADQDRWRRMRAGARAMHRRPVPATPPTTSPTRRGRRRASSFSMGYGRLPWRSGSAAGRRDRAERGPRTRGGARDPS
jgi:CO/xanthine dehydrogenase Mo-binding subunit